MLPAKLDYAAPTTVQDAVQTLASNPNALFVAGSYNLMIDLKMRRVTPDLLVDLRKIPDLYELTADDNSVRIGAMVSLRALMDDETIRARCTALAEAAEKTGDAQIRNMTAIGGALAYNATGSALTAAVLALGATIYAAGARGSRTIAADEFFLGARSTALAADEIITAITVPYHAGASVYEQFKHPANLGAVCGVAAHVGYEADGSVGGIRLAVTGATASAVRLTAAEAALQGQVLSVDSINRAASVAANGLECVSDLHFSAEYRAHLVTILTARALKRLI